MPNKNALRVMLPRLLLLAAATLLLIGGLFAAWQAWQIYSAEQAGATALQIRDQQAAALSRLLLDTQKRAEQSVADESVQAHSLQKGAPAQAQGDAKDTPRYLALALPVQRDHRTVAYAYLQLPMTPLLNLFHQQSAIVGAQIDLRQGSIGSDQLIEHLGIGGENSPGVSVPVLGSLFRISVWQPEEFVVLPQEPTPLFIIATVLLLLAGALFWLRMTGIQRVVGRMRRQKSFSDEPTLAQSLRDQASTPVAADATKPIVRLPAPRKDAPPALLDPGIFRAYDIRGVLGKTLDAAVARGIGHAIGSEARARGLLEVVVGRDGRLSGPELSAALIQGLRASGCNVIDIGAVPTPTLYFATYHLHAGSGVMVTGSHNPPDYNGFKIVLGGETLAEGAIRDLYRRINDGDLSDGEGTLQTMDITREYIDRITGDVQVQRKLKVVVDCGNGIPGASAPGILRALGCDVIDLYSRVDGDFPNHHPDPSKPENLVDLIRTVHATEAELGLAFDGDGDRLGVVTRGGNIIYPDRQLMLFARDILTRVKGAPIIYDVKCSQRLPIAIRDAGGVPLMWKTGHSLVKAKLKETGAPIAGEMSGHIFFSERWYGFDDATYTAARLLEILSRSADPSAVLDELPTSFSTPELNVACAEGEPPKIIERLLAEAKFPGAEILTIDGLRAEYDDGFGLIRASNTTPVLVLRFEGHTQAALERIQHDFMEALRKVKPGAQIGAAAH